MRSVGCGGCEEVQVRRRVGRKRKWDFKDFRLELWSGNPLIFLDACTSRVLINYSWQLDYVFNWVPKMSLSHRGVPWSLLRPDHVTSASPVAKFSGNVSLSIRVFLTLWQELAGPTPPSWWSTVLSLRSCNTIFFLFLFQLAGHSLPLRCPLSLVWPLGTQSRVSPPLVSISCAELL